MAPTRKDLDLAIAAYWKTKGKQQAAAEAISSKAEGTAKAVRGGRQFHPVVNLIARFPTKPLPKEPDPKLNWRRFSAAIKARLAYLSGLGLP